MLVLTSVNGFGFRFEILYLCTAEEEIPLRIGGISTFLSKKSHFGGQKISYIVFSGLNNRFLMLLILAPQIDIIMTESRLSVNVC